MSYRSQQREAFGSQPEEKETVVVERDGNFEVVNLEELKASERGKHDVRVSGTPVAEAEPKKSENNVNNSDQHGQMKQPFPPKQRRPVTAIGPRIRRKLRPAETMQRLKSAPSHRTKPEPISLKNFTYTSPFALSPSQKEWAKQRTKALEIERREEEKQKKEKEEKETEKNEEAFQAWLTSKLEEQRKKKAEEDEKEKAKQDVKKQKEKEKEEKEIYFEAWMEKTLEGERKKKAEKDEEKEKAKQDKPKREKEEEEKKEAVQAWFKQKLEEQKLEEQRKKKVEDDEAKRKSEQDKVQKKEIKRAYKDWLGSKRVQMKRERLLKRCQAQDTMDTTSLEDAEQAYTEWVKKKNSESRMRREMEKQRSRFTHARNHSHKNAALLRAIRNSRSFRYVDYRNGMIHKVTVRYLSELN